MPELPEVETMVRGVRATLAGASVADVRSTPCACRPLDVLPGWTIIRRHLLGQPVTALERLGKRIVLRVGSGAALVIEPRMTGLLALADFPDDDHVRFVISVTAPSGKLKSVWFWDRRGLGTVRLRLPGEVLCPRLGPDALQMDSAGWSAICAVTRQPIKVALLDQQRVAGIGNLYASEILHVAGIHPGQPARTLTDAQIARLHSATLHVLHEAIRYEGSTLADGTYRNALNKAGGYQNQHRVYAKAGHPCATCGQAEIERSVQAQRSTFHCPSCQRLPRGRRKSPR